MKYIVQMASGDMIYIYIYICVCVRLFMMIDSGTQLISRLFPQEFERLQCWYY
jgi:hypothetical protein